MKRQMLILTAALSAGACGDRASPTAPGDPVPVERAPLASPAFSVASLTSSLSAVEDAIERLLAGLPKGSAHDDLRNALTSLAASIESGDAAGIRTYRRAAEDALKRLGQRAPAEFGPDLDATKLAIEAIEEPDDNDGGAGKTPSGGGNGNGSGGSGGKKTG